MPEPDLAPLPDPDRFTEEQWRAVDGLFELDEVPRGLSGLLAHARMVDPDLAGLVVLRALHAFSPEVGTAVRQGERRLVVAVDDGTAWDAARDLLRCGRRPALPAPARRLAIARHQ